MLAIYARVSKDKDDKKNSIETQIALGKAYAQTKGLAYEIYEDNGVSGTLEIENRPALYELTKDITLKKITHVFAYDQSRLERNNNVWGTLFLLFETNGIKLFFQNTGEFDFSSDMNFVNSNMLSIFNAFYVKLTKRKVVTALQRNIETGKVHASPPFGYTKDSNKFLIINEEESEIVKRIYAMSLEGKGTDKIAEILNLEGIPTAYSKLEKGGVYKIRDRYNPTIITEKNKSDAKWRGKTIQGIIKNPIYKGQRFWKGNYYTAPRIFDEVYWQKVNDNLQNNRNNTGKKVEHKYLLRGIIKCSCGRNMYGRSRMNKRDHTYICSSRRYKGENCGNRAINIDKIENIIWGHFFIEKKLLKLLNEASNSGDSVLENLLIEKKVLEKRFEDNEKGKQNLMRFIAGGAITMDDARIQLEQIKNDNNKIKVEISEMELRISNFKDFERLIVDTTEDFKKYTLETDFEVKRNLVHKYINKIVVAYNDVSEFPNSYSLDIEFKNEIVRKKYIFSVKEGYLISFRDRAIEKLEGSEIRYVVSFDDINNKVLYTQDGKQLLKPHFYVDNHLDFVSNTFIPYGEMRDWTLQSIIDFYELNPHWLSDESGINIYTIKEPSTEYNWFLQNYKEYKEKDIKEWFTFLFEKHLNAINKRFNNK